MKSILTVIFFLPLIVLAQDSSYGFDEFEGFAITRHIKYYTSYYRPDFIYLVPANNKDTSSFYTTIWSGLWRGGDKSNYGFEIFFDTTVKVKIPKLSEARIIPMRIFKKNKSTINKIKIAYGNTEIFKFDIYYVKAKVIYRKINVDTELFEEELTFGNYISRNNLRPLGNNNTLCNYSFLYHFQRFYKIDNSLK